MKAIRVGEFGPPEVLRIEEVDDPNPSDGEIPIAVVEGRRSIGAVLLTP